jgi:sugar lactone lactonase YvrE
MTETLNLQVELVWDLRCELGECCTWDAATGSVLFCDIPAGRIHAWRVADATAATWQLPELVASFGLCRSGRLVVALRDRVAFFDRGSGALTPLAGPLGQPASVRLNDGKVGPDGCFWVGGMDETRIRQPIAALWRITPDGRVERRGEGYKVSNGLAWSADGTMMFHSDTTPGLIEAFDFDRATGDLANRRLLATLRNEDGRPDGAATDAEGCYWSAGNSAACLNRFSPAGAMLAKVPLPVPAPTMPCFADRAIYVTTLRHGKDADTLARHPAMGGLFRLPAPVAGVPVDLFADR